MTEARQIHRLTLLFCDSSCSAVYLSNEQVTTVSSYSQNAWFFLPDLTDKCLDNRKVKYTPAHISLLIFHSCEHTSDSAHMQTQILGMPLPIKMECSEIEMFNRCFKLGKKAICFCLLPMQSNLTYVFAGFFVLEFRKGESSFFGTCCKCSA